MTLSLLVIIALGAALTLMAVLWVAHLAKGEADIVDAGWAASVGLTALIVGHFGPGDFSRRLLLTALVGLWSARLTWFLLTTRVMKPGEDGRYIELRASWGESAPWRFFIFFEVQGALAVLLAIPFFVVAFNELPLSVPVIVLSLALWSVSICGETIADRDLSRFRADPANKGKVCNKGLWRYSRHPNYFFEWIHWWAYVVLAWGSPWFLLSFISPFIMFYLITKVTGIPPTEARSLISRGEAYKEYQRTTNAFFPWLPKKDVTFKESTK